ncbi:hypothetical protein CA54_22820 [Symmachiella macrocystis]|uniref:Uncharacterized protein n=1 Tax=Symmachiella macrocystis TaxID=2527985 RepID=A0A5C6BNW7_9PLAN|nr:hypothetical protein CA54_22820 [Symmachiella macrocystis]
MKERIEFSGGENAMFPPVELVQSEYVALRFPDRTYHRTFATSVRCNLDSKLAMGFPFASQESAIGWYARNCRISQPIAEAILAENGIYGRYSVSQIGASRQTRLKLLTALKTDIVAVLFSVQGLDPQGCLEVWETASKVVAASSASVLELCEPLVHDDWVEWRSGAFTRLVQPVSDDDILASVPPHERHEQRVQRLKSMWGLHGDTS